MSNCKLSARNDKLQSYELMQLRKRTINDNYERYHCEITRSSGRHVFIRVTLILDTVKQPLSANWSTILHAAMVKELNENCFQLLFHGKVG